MKKMNHFALRASRFAFVVLFAFCVFCAFGVIYAGAEDTQSCVTHNFDENCICTACGESNHAIGDDFRCTNCESYDEPELNDNGYYLIYNASELFWFAAHVNAGNGNVMAFIKNDIDLGGVEWTPIGTENNPFKGYISGENNGANEYFVIKGLNVVATKSYAGFIGNMDCSDSTTLNRGVDFLTVYGEITIAADGIDCIGGIVGSSNAMIRKCFSYVDIKQSDGVTETAYIGGVVGRAECEGCEIFQSAYFGSINLLGARAVGGVAGSAFGYKIHDCANHGSVKTDGEMIGGIAGLEFWSEVYNCLNTGEVVGSGSVGAIIGALQNVIDIVENNYYLDSSCAVGIGDDPYDIGEAIAVTADFLASGEMAWLLNGRAPLSTWRQDIDFLHPEAYPRLNGHYDYVYYATACGGEGKAYTNFENGQLHISHDTAACVNCGAEVFVVVDGVAYFEGDDITNTGIDVSDYIHDNEKYNKVYLKAGEGYVLLTLEDFETEFADEVKKYERRRVLTLHNATIDLRDTDKTTAIEQGTTLKIVFEGENNIYSNSGIHFSGSGAASDALVLVGRGKDAVLNFYGEGGSPYFLMSSHAIHAGVVLLESGTVNTVNTSSENTWLTRAQSLLYVNEGATLNVIGGYLVVGDYINKDYVGGERFNLEGELNAVALTANVISDSEVEFVFDVYGNATYPGEFVLPDEVMVGVTHIRVLNIPEGATLTVPEGITLNLDSFTSVEIDGELIVKGMLICTHEGGEANCTTLAICDICKQSYGETLEHKDENKDHICDNGCGAVLEACTPNADDGDCTTDITCSVCGEVTAEGADAHTGGTATCEHKAECTVCGKEYGELADHTYVDGKCECGKTDPNYMPGTDTPGTDVPSTDDPETDDPDAGTSKDPNSGNTGEPSDKDDGLGAGAIAGIVAGSVAVLGGGGFVLWWFVFRKKRII